MKYKESETTEFKKSTSELKEAVIAVAAILNKHGMGKVYFGIKNDGSIIGQDIGENTVRQVSQAITDNIEPKVFPKIAVGKIKGRVCVMVTFSGSAIPYFAFGRAYMRVGDENKQLTARELEKLILKKHREGIDWEKQYSRKRISEVNVKVLRNYISRANEAGRINFKFDSVKNVLRKLGLLSGNRFLKAAEILFCNTNSLEVQAAVFAGIDKLTFLDIKKFEGNIFELLDKSEKYITERINWRVQFGRMEREEIPEVPVKAIREALVNSLCHRDYTNPKGNEVAIFKDRVEIYNPGDFPEGYTPDDFIKGKERSILRNPLIAEIIYKSKDIEKWGSGLKRIYDESRANKVPVEFKVLKSGFLVIFRRKLEWVGRKGEGVSEGVSEGVNSIIEYIKQNPGKRAPYIAGASGVPLKTLERWLKKLKAEGKIRYEGSAKTGGYHLRT